MYIGVKMETEDNNQTPITPPAQPSTPLQLQPLDSTTPIEPVVKTDPEPNLENFNTSDLKLEDPNAARPKIEEPKVAEPKVEEPKVEEPKIEEPKVEELKAEESKIEEPKVEELKAEESKLADPTSVPASPVSATTALPLAPKKKTLSITIKDKAVLYAAYMPFLKNGGLFIPTKKTFVMGEECSLVISLLDDENRYSVMGRVVWITPSGSPTNKAGGIGVEFAESIDGETIRRKIEDMLGTHTM